MWFIYLAQCQLLNQDSCKNESTKYLLKHHLLEQDWTLGCCSVNKCTQLRKMKNTTQQRMIWDSYYIHEFFLPCMPSSKLNQGDQFLSQALKWPWRESILFPNDQINKYSIHYTFLYVGITSYGIMSLSKGIWCFPNYFCLRLSSGALLGMKESRKMCEF